MAHSHCPTRSARVHVYVKGVQGVKTQGHKSRRLQGSHSAPAARTLGGKKASSLAAATASLANCIMAGGRAWHTRGGHPPLRDPVLGICFFGHRGTSNLVRRRRGRFVVSWACRVVYSLQLESSQVRMPIRESAMQMTAWHGLACRGKGTRLEEKKPLPCFCPCTYPRHATAHTTRTRILSYFTPGDAVRVHFLGVLCKHLPLLHALAGGSWSVSLNY